MGGPGDDVLIGGRASDLLIGGTGADRLNGQQGDDILIAGTTVFDSDYQSLCTLLADWDAGRNVSDRLNDQTVHHDGSNDVLVPGPGRHSSFSTASLTVHLANRIAVAEGSPLKFQSL